MVGDSLTTHARWMRQRTLRNAEGSHGSLLILGLVDEIKVPMPTVARDIADRESPAARKATIRCLEAEVDGTATIRRGVVRGFEEDPLRQDSVVVLEGIQGVIKL